MDRRGPAAPDAAQRLMDGRVEGLPGWTVDRFGGAALIQCFERDGAPDDVVDGLCSLLLERDDVQGVVLKERSVRDRARGVGRVVAGTLPAAPDDDPFSERPGRLVIDEGGLRFGIDLLYGFNVGLFLDAAPLRALARERADGRRVLNLFSYTAGFGVAAAAGGARSTTNVDLVPSALDRGRANYALNGLPVDPRGHVRSDVFQFLRRARKKTHRWDLVVLDPPPVATQGKRGRTAYEPARDLGKALRHALDVTAEGGAVLFMTAASEELFEAALAEAGEERTLKIEALQRAADHPGDDGMRARWIEPLD